MRVACVMMCKNEDDLIAPWAAHHGALFGYDNLVIMDNGSTNPGFLRALEAVEAKGALVDRRWPEPAHYTRQGELQARWITQMDRIDPRDVYLPLDCDEFVGAERPDGTVAFDRAGVEAALVPHLGDRGALMIGAGYMNCLAAPGAFQRRPQVRKTFFAQGACAALDNGAHAGMGMAADRRTRTAIVYAHFHFKPHALYIAHARERLRAYADGLDEASLLLHQAAQRPNFHIIDKLFEDEARFNSRIDPASCTPLPELSQAFRRIGMALPFTSADQG